MELIKEILFWTALLGGSICLISLIMVAAFRSLCLLLDHLKIGKAMIECIPIYIERKNNKNKGGIK